LSPPPSHPPVALQQKSVWVEVSGAETFFEQGGGGAFVLTQNFQAS